MEADGGFRQELITDNRYREMQTYIETCGGGANEYWVRAICCLLLDMASIIRISKDSA